MATLDPNELAVLGFIRRREPVRVEEIVRWSYQDEKDINRFLTGLLDKGLIRKNQAGMFEIKIFAAGK